MLLNLKTFSTSSSHRPSLFTKHGKARFPTHFAPLYFTVWRQNVCSVNKTASTLGEFVPSPDPYRGSTAGPRLPNLAHLSKILNMPFRPTDIASGDVECAYRRLAKKKQTLSAEVHNCTSRRVRAATLTNSVKTRRTITSTNKKITQRKQKHSGKSTSSAP